MPVVGEHGRRVIDVRRQSVEDREQRHPALPDAPEDRPRHLVRIARGGRDEDDQVGRLEQLDGERAVAELDAVEVRRVDNDEAAPRPGIGPYIDGVARGEAGKQPGPYIVGMGEDDGPPCRGAQDAARAERRAGKRVEEA